MTVQPYRLYAAAELAQHQQAVAPDLLTWQQMWLGDLAIEWQPLRPLVAGDVEALPPLWSVTEGICCSLSPIAEARLLAAMAAATDPAMFMAGRRRPLMRAWLLRALRALVDAWGWAARVSVDGVDASRPGPDWARPGSGGLMAEGAIGGDDIRLLIAPGVARHRFGGQVSDAALTAAATRLQPVNAVVMPLTVTCQASLRGGHIRRAELKGLSVGDVLSLDHRVDDEVAVQTEAGHYLGAARPGRVGHNRALRLQ